MSEVLFGEYIKSPELDSEAKFWVDVLRFLGGPIAELYSQLADPIPEKIRNDFDKWVITYYKLEDVVKRGEIKTLPSNVFEKFKEESQGLLDLIYKHSGNTKDTLTLQ